MHRKMTRFLSLFLSAAMMMGSLSLPAAAAESSPAYAETAAEAVEEEQYAAQEEAEADPAKSAEAEEPLDTAEETAETPDPAGEAPAEEAADEEDAAAADEPEEPVSEAEESSPEAEEPAFEAEEPAPESGDETEPVETDPAAARTDRKADSADAPAEGEAVPAETAVTTEDAAGTAEEAVTDTAVDAAGTSEIPLTGQGYVLMNIPYADFYAAEGVDDVDAVSSSTKAKPRTWRLAAGSYHVHADGSDISGITYPVFVEDLSVLEGLTRITDDSSVEITVTNRGQTTIETYSGKDALFEAPDYAFYVLGGEPAASKKLTVAGDGSFSFGAVSRDAQTVQGVTGEVTYNGRHTDIEIPLDGTDGISQGDMVSAVVLTDADGNRYGMRHVYNIWRATELGWNDDELDLYGKTIVNIRYITQEAVIDYPVEIALKNRVSGAEAAFDGLEKVVVTGLPADIENPKATVSSVVGRGETPVVIADGADVADGVIVTAQAAVAGTQYTVKVVSDNYADVSVSATAYAREDMSAVTLGGVQYYYADTAEDDPEFTSYHFSVTTGRGSSAVTTDYAYLRADLTRVAGTDFFYIAQPGATPLTGTLYGFENGSGSASDYRTVYGGLGVNTDTDPAYDAVTSATGFSGFHAKDIPSLVTFGTDADGEKAITGLTLGRSTKTVDATAYVEAGILQAAGRELTADQKAALDLTLKVNPMDAPAESEIAVRPADASFAACRYGAAEFVIVPDDTVEGYVWSEYWNSVYAATVSDGKNTAGAVHWIDLYGEAAVSGHHYNRLEIALNDGVSKGSNEADVSRYAAFFDGGYIKAGTYTIKVYAEGYTPLTAEVAVDRGLVLKDKTVVYKGQAVGIEASAPAEIDGEVVYSWYSDRGCTAPLNGQPKDAGTYYVRAVAADMVTSNVAKLTISKAAQAFTAKAAAATVQAGRTTKITASGAKETAKYTYTSSDKSVATVSSDGTVTGKKAGTVTITVTTPETKNYKKGTKTVKVTVQAALKKPGNCHFVKWNNKKYTSCQIAWKKVAGADGYQTLLSWTDGSHASSKILKANVLSQNCAVAANHVSQLKVRAFVNTAGGRVYGPWSNVEYITPSPAATFRFKNVSTASQLKAKISWNIIYGCNGYNVFVTTNPNGTWYWNQSTSVKANATSATITKYRGSKLKKNTTYYVRIVTRRKRNGVFCTVPMPAKNTYIGSFTIK